MTGFDAEWVAGYRLRGAGSRGRTRRMDIVGYNALLNNPALTLAERAKYSSRLLEIRGDTEKADAMRARMDERLAAA